MPLSLTVVLLWPSLVQAKPRRLSDLGDRSRLEEVRFNPGAPQSLQMNIRMQSQRVEFGQWHGTFSTIGNKRSNVSTDERFSTTQLNYPMVERRDAAISMDISERRMAPLRNVDQVRDIVMARQFSDVELRTKEGRALQEMVDEMTLKDINRFQAHRNKTDEGVPVQQAGSSDAPVVSPVRKSSENSDS